MKRLKLNILLLACILLYSLLACDDEKDNLGSLRVELERKAEASIPLSQITVQLSNAANGISLSSKTDAQGIAAFTQLMEGVYNIKVDENVEGIWITGSLNDIQVVRAETKTCRLPIEMQNSYKGGLVIKELYYNASNDPTYTVMFRDQFIEIFNNSGHVIYADGLYVANLFGDSFVGQSGAIVSKTFDITKNVYADWVARIPGNGKDCPVPPGKGLVIALNAINFQKEVEDMEGAVPANEVDLSKARFEFYSYDWIQEHRGKEGSSFDQNNPDVPNMDNVFITPELDMCLMDMMGTSLVIFRLDKELSKQDIASFEYATKSGKLETVSLMKVPVPAIIDGVEMLNRATAGTAACKRLPISIDSGFSFLTPEGDGSMTGKSARRKKDVEASKKIGRTVLKDTDNSTVDIEILERPTPYGYDNN